MKRAFVLLACVCLGPAARSHAGDAPAAPPDLRPLDTRTRCIVLFREALVLVHRHDIAALLTRIADGSGPRFKVFPEGARLPGELAEELKDPERFMDHNFPHAATIFQSFDAILFSDAQTKSEEVEVVAPDKTTKSKGRLHVIHVKIPGVDDPRFTELRVLEVGRTLYWVPFGW